MPLLVGPRNFKDVNRKDFWTSKTMPALGLIGDASLDWRIYVLRCKPGCKRTRGLFFYVGFEHVTQVVNRINVQAFGGGKNPKVKQSHFCQINKPEEVGLLWPVAGRSAEGYMLSAL